MTTSIPSNIPSFSLNAGEFTQISNTKVKQLNVYNSQKVTLVNTQGKTLEIKPEGFANHFCSNADFLSSFRWHVAEANDGSYSVKAMSRLLGGGNDHPVKSSKKKSKVSNTVNNQTNLNPEEQQLLEQYLDFFQKDYTNTNCQARALEKACNTSNNKDYARICIPEDPVLQLNLLNILLFKLNISPTLKSGINFVFEPLLNIANTNPNEEALQLFLKAGLPYKDIPLDKLLSLKLFKTFTQCLDNGVVLNQRVIKVMEPSAFFSDKMLEAKYKHGPFFHRLVGSTWSDPQFFNYAVQKRTDLGNYVNTRDDDGCTLLMSMLQAPTQHDSRLQWLLNQSPNMEMVDIHGRTALFYLLMSTDVKTFEYYLNLLRHFGLDLNKEIKDSLNHFSYCMHLLLETNMKWRDTDLFTARKHPGLSEKIALMAKYCDAHIPSDIYLQLPEYIRETVDHSLSESTSSNGSPIRLSESPQKSYADLMASPFRDLYALIDPTCNPQNPQIIAFKDTLTRAFQNANLIGLLNQANTNDVQAQSLFRQLTNQLKPLIMQRAHENPIVLEMFINNILSSWTKEMNSQRQMKELAYNNSQQQAQFTKEELARIERARLELDAATESAKHQTTMARLAVRAADDSASYANRAAGRANVAAMNASTYGKSYF